MKGRKRNTAKRIGALLLCVLMVLTGYAGIDLGEGSAWAADGDSKAVTLQITDGTNALSGCTVALTKAAGEAQSLTDAGDGTYTATLTVGETYAYTVTKDGYTTVSGSFDVTDDMGTVDITMSTAAAAENNSTPTGNEGDGNGENNANNTNDGGGIMPLSGKTDLAISFTDSGSKEIEVLNEASKTFEIPVQISADDDRSYTYKVTSGTDMMSVATSGNKGTVTISKVGIGEIKVTAQESDTYNAAEATYKVTVKMKEEEVTLDDLLKGDTSRVKVSTGNGIKKDENNTDIYAKPSSMLTMSIRYTTSDACDKVYVRWTGDSNATNLSDGYTIPYNVTSLTGKMYLMGTSTITKEVDLTVYVDNEAPNVAFSNEGWTSEPTLLDKLGTSLTFGHFKSVRENLTLNVNITDTSGVSEAKYTVVKRDAKTTGITKSEIDSLTGNDSSWSSIDLNNPQVQVLTETDTDSYYIAVVYVKDALGNKAYYCSNGLVYDITSPTISITDSEENSLSDKIYGKDGVECTIVVTDPTKDASNNDAAASGVTKATVAVYKKYGTNDQNQIGDTVELGASDSDPAATGTISELGDIKINKKYKLDPSENDELNSDDITLVVTAMDQAGNKYEATQTFSIDNSDPEVEISFDNNDVKNGKYYKADRTATVTITERNFDEKKVDITDSEGAELTPSNWSNDGEKHTCTVKFSEDGDYKLNVKCIDKAGNEATKSSEEFTIDKTDPEISVSYYYMDEGNKNLIGDIDNKTRNYNYKDKTIYAEVTITEHNFYTNSGFSSDPEQMVFTATKGTDASGGDITITDYERKAEEKGNWSAATGKVDVYTTTFEFATEANYSFGFTYTDLSGRSVAYGPDLFTVDKTDPSGTIKIGEKRFKDTLFDTLTFGFFTNNKQDITVNSSDEIAGISSVKYYIYVPDVNKKNSFTGLTKDYLEKLREDEWKVLVGDTVSISEESQDVLYVRIIDKVGHTIYINHNEGIIVDKTNPNDPVITITTATPANGIFNRDVNFKIDVTDPALGGTYAGLKSVSYEIQKDGVVTQSGDYNSELNEPAARVQSISKSETVSASKNNSNNVKIVVTAVDYAGNTSTETKDISIDITAPVVTITFDQNSPQNGKYYNTTRTATISVKERNFNPNAVNLSITNSDGTMPAISGWSISPLAGKSDEAVNTCTVTFSADGDYTMSMHCTDLAGNSSNTVTVDEFTVDKTQPIISISFDNNNVRNGKYYNAARTATITITEHNFNPQDVRIAINSSTVTPNVNGWSSAGDVHTATIAFTADGDYSFTVNYADLAANSAEEQTVAEFTVDTTAPEVEIFDIEDKSANNDTVAPGVRYSDTNYDVNGVSIVYSGANHTEEAVDGDRTSIPNGESIKMADFAHEKSVDDLYTMSASVTDLAGNTTEKSVTFSVNRFGSVFIFSEDTEEFVDDYYNNAEENLIVTEYNVDTLVHRGITSGREGTLTELETGSDYTVRESGSEVSWKSYRYTLKKENFEKEGKYSIVIDSTDRAGNEINNQITQKGIEKNGKWDMTDEEAQIEFVIDKTAPTIVLSGVEDEGRYRESSRSMTVSVEDNILLSTINVYVDQDGNVKNNESLAYEDSTVSEDGKIMKNNKEQSLVTAELTYTLGDYTDWQKIKAVAVDKAGNTTDTSVSDENNANGKWISVLVTKSLWTQFYQNKPVFIGTIMLVIALAAVAFWWFFIMGKKRKKDKEEGVAA